MLPLSAAPIRPLSSEKSIVFLIDASSGVTRDIYQKEKDFVKELGRHFNINPAGPRGSVVQYAGNPLTLVGFKDPAFIGKVDDSSVIGSPRRIDKALEHAATLLRKQNGKKIVILLAAGRQAPGGKPLGEAVKPLKSMKAKTFVVAIGDEANQKELQQIVEQSQSLYTVPPEDLIKRSRTIAISGKEH